MIEKSRKGRHGSTRGLLLVLGLMLCWAAPAGATLPATAPVLRSAPQPQALSFYQRHQEALWVLSLALLLQGAALLVLYRGGRRRRQALLMLRESEERFRMLAESSQTGIYIVSCDETVLYVNRTLAEMFGYRPDEIIGNTFRHYLCEEDHELVARNFDDRICGNPVPRNYQVRGKHRGGHFVDLEIFSALSRAFGGATLIGTVLDITERKAGEQAMLLQRQELEQMNRTLELRVAQEVERNRERDRLIMQQSRFAAMGEMIGNIAHQWRQPLNVLGILVQQMQMEQEKGQLSGEVMEQQVAKIMELLLCLSKTIDDFRNFFRPNREPRSFSLDKAVTSTVDFFQPCCSAHGIAISIEAGCNLRYTGHVNEFSQAVLNILNNARDALQERRIAAPAIRVCLKEAAGRAVLTICDNAGGIPDEVIDKIFDPYFSTKEEGKGTGIGLYMTKGIIERQMQGSISVRNRPEGAEFSIVL